MARPCLWGGLRQPGVLGEPGGVQRVHGEAGEALEARQPQRVARLHHLCLAALCAARPVHAHAGMLCADRHACRHVDLTTQVSREGERAVYYNNQMAVAAWQSLLGT